MDNPLQTPLVSVIMPAYNAEKFIRQAIDSILGQTYTNWELLVADDGSADKTPEIVKIFTSEDSRVKLFSNKKNEGLLKTRNKLIKLSKGDYIAFQDADDYSAPERLYLQLNEFDKNADLGICGTNIQIVSEQCKPIRVHKRPPLHNEITEKMKEFNQFGGATLMIKRSALNDVGLFRQFFNGLACQEYDLAYLIIEKYKSANIQKPLYYYRMHENSNSKIISIDRVLAYDLVQTLAIQREKYGQDMIQQGKTEELKKIFENLKKPYNDDPALIYRYFASNFLYSGLKLKAINTAFKGILANPAKMINYRTLVYCLRKSIF